ncbi:hypothetical protein Tco_1244364, partial [Tanacetum coccineum]
MTVHNRNLQMDGDDQDSSTVIIGYCPDMFPAFKVSLQFHGVPMIALICLHVPKMTALYYGTLILPRSPLNFQVGPIRILMSIGQWHPKLHGVISASSFHGKIGIYKVEACARYSVGEDSVNLTSSTVVAALFGILHLGSGRKFSIAMGQISDTSFLLKLLPLDFRDKRDFGSLLLVGKFNMVVPLLSRSLKVGASWRCPNTRNASGNGEKLTGICQCRSQQHIDGGGANVRLHSAGLSLASTTNGDSLNTLTFGASLFEGDQKCSDLLNPNDCNLQDCGKQCCENHNVNG